MPISVSRNSRSSFCFSAGERSHDVPGRTIHDWRHYLAMNQRKPNALYALGPRFVRPVEILHAGG